MTLNKSIFYGWWMVWACFISAVVSWSLGVFGISVYLHTICQSRGWSVSLVSSSVTLFYFVGAACSILVGKAIARFGPQPVMMFGGLSLAISVIGMGQVTQPWHIHVSFMIMGTSYACLGTTAISTTLAPWFEKHQGRVVAISLTGASVGGMIGAPILIYMTTMYGFSTATLIAGIIAFAIVSPIAIFVLRRRPQDLGLLPDGDLPAANSDIEREKIWSSSNALRSAAFWSVVITFGMALSMQLGFLTHHVSLVTPLLGEAGASITVSLTGCAGLVGRLALSKYADRIDLRVTTSFLLIIASFSFATLAFIPNWHGLVIGSLVYGFTLGNITSLSPIIIRREFGALSFGAIYGAASTVIGAASALGPTIWGILHDAFDSYTPALLTSATLDLIAAAIVLSIRAPGHLTEQQKGQAAN